MRVPKTVCVGSNPIPRSWELSTESFEVGGSSVVEQRLEGKPLAGFVDPSVTTAKRDDLYSSFRGCV
jgi:hypothetical protein